MKKTKIISCALAVMLSAGILTVLPEQLNDKVSIAITADAASSDFILDSSKTGIDGYRGSGGDIVIPDGIKYINEGAFEGSHQISSITSKGDLYIKRNAFQGCTRLSKVLIKGDTYFEDNAFDKCVNLEKVEVSGSIDRCIGDRAFANCTALKYFNVKGSEYEFSIDDLAFFNCVCLNEFTIPTSCTSIGNYAFLNCPKLRRLTIPGKTKISSYDEPFGYSIAWFASFIEDQNADRNKTAVRPSNLISRNFFDSYSYDGYDNERYAYVYNNGTTSMYIDYLSYNNRNLASPCTVQSSFCESNHYDLYIIRDRFLPQQISLNVVKGSSAETYAKNKKIPYNYYTEKKTDKTNDKSDKITTSKTTVKAPAAPATVIVHSKTKNSVTIKWTGVSKADAYIVYVYNTKTAKYEKYKTVSKNSCVIKGLKKNTSYKIKVSSVTKSNGKSAEGKKSKTLTVKTKSK